MPAHSPGAVGITLGLRGGQVHMQENLEFMQPPFALSVPRVQGGVLYALPTFLHIGFSIEIIEQVFGYVFSVLWGILMKICMNVDALPDLPVHLRNLISETRKM